MFTAIILLCSVAGATLVIWAMTDAVGKAYDANAHHLERLVRVLVLSPIAHLLVTIEHLALAGARRAYHNNTPLEQRFYDIAEAVSMQRSHHLSRAVGVIDDACMDQAQRAGFDAWELTCGDHRCGQCETCREAGITRREYDLWVLGEVRLRLRLTKWLDFLADKVVRRPALRWMTRLFDGLLVAIDPGQNHRFAHAANVQCFECWVDAQLLPPEPGESLFAYVARSIAAEHGAVLAKPLTIGDACQAIGSSRQGVVMDNFGDSLMVQWDDEMFCRLVRREDLTAATG